MMWRTIRRNFINRRPSRRRRLRRPMLASQNRRLAHGTVSGPNFRTGIPTIRAAHRRALFLRQERDNTRRSLPERIPRRQQLTRKRRGRIGIDMRRVISRTTRRRRLTRNPLFRRTPMRRPRMRLFALL
jgi:hypothetical protein